MSLSLHEVVNAVRYDLQKLAQVPKTIFYSNLASKHNIPYSNEDERHTFHLLLENIDELELQEGRPPVSVVVVRVEDKIPGIGFFTWSWEHYKNYDLTETDIKHYNEEKLFEYYTQVFNDCYKYWDGKLVIKKLE